MCDVAYFENLDNAREHLKNCDECFAEAYRKIAL